ncbi:MAG: hypothetical protein PHR49_04580, partial [Methanoculleus sp.]|nr:hypothetical protein [Methanoculleus sp.]
CDNVKEGYYIEQGYSFKNPQSWEKTYELGPLAFLNNPFRRAALHPAGRPATCRAQTGTG